MVIISIQIKTVGFIVRNKMGAPDDEWMGIYILWTAQKLEIASPEPETFTQGALNHADQCCLNKESTLHLKVLNGRV